MKAASNNQESSKDESMNININNEQVNEQLNEQANEPDFTQLTEAELDAMLDAATEDMDLSKADYSAIGKNDAQGFATLKLQHKGQDDEQFAIYAAHRASSKFISKFAIRLNDMEQADIEQAKESGEMHTLKQTSKNGEKQFIRHYVPKGATQVIKQLPAQLLEHYMVKLD